MRKLRLSAREAESIIVALAFMTIVFATILGAFR